MINHDLKIKIRTFNLSDMSAAVLMEKNNFEFPWDEPDFKRVWKSTRTASIVAEIDKELVGYLFYDVAKTNYEIMSLNVKKEFQRKKIGSKLIDVLLTRLGQSYHKNHVLVSVRETNLSACQFFRSQGFQAFEIVKNAYQEVHDDAYRMKYKLPIQEIMEKLQ